MGTYSISTIASTRIVGDSDLRSIRLNATDRGEGKIDYSVNLGNGTDSFGFASHAKAKAFYEESVAMMNSNVAIAS